MSPLPTGWIAKAEAEKHSPVIRCYIAASEKLASLLHVKPQDLSFLLVDPLSQYIAFADLALEEGMRKQPHDSEALLHVKSIFTRHEHDARLALMRELRMHLTDHPVKGVTEQGAFAAIEKEVRDTFAAIQKGGKRS